MKPGFFALPLLLIAGCARTGAAEEDKQPGVGPVDSKTVSGKAEVADTTDQQPESTVDLMISLHVQQALLDDKATAPDAGAIRVTTREGVVSLRGFVSSDAVKKRAVVVVKAVGSVTRVDDQLVVDPEAAKTRQPVESVMDRTVSGRVRLALLEDRTLADDARTVHIVTQNGVVILSGTVSSETVKTRMGVVSNAVGSVSRVINQLTVKPH